MIWKFIVASLFAVSCASAQTLVGTSLSAPVVSGGGGGGSNITAAFDCRSFGQTASDGGTLNIKYATPIMCWATDTVVSSTAVNRTGWVPEVWFEWNWDDNSLGSVTRAGQSIDLQYSIGLVAAHLFRPSAFAETCNGGTNSSHTVTLTVHSVVAGVRESDSATMTVCVEDPATTWPNPIAYCDDADCSNDTFSNVVNPGTPTHGGNGTALNQILDDCTSSSNRILVEGGVTFTTASTGILVGANSCLVESYGTGQAKFHFTSTAASAAIAAEHANCAGYRVMEVTLAGSGSGPRVIAGETDTGCYALIDTDTTNTAGEEFRGLTVSDPGGGSQQSEGYYFLVDYGDQHPTLGTANFYAYANYLAFVGGSLTGPKKEHNWRLPQWSYIVLDASLLSDHTTGYNMIRMAQDCGATTLPCANSAEAHTFTMSRNVIVANEATTTPVQICNSGSGSTESTQCFDMDFLRNVTYQGGLMSAAIDWFYRFEPGTTGNTRERIRVMQNLCDMTGYDSTSDAANCFAASGTVDKIAFFGNVVWRGDAGGATAATCSLFNGNPANFTSGNNVAAEDVGGSCTPFLSASEASTDLTFTSEIFNAGTPVDYAPEWSQFKITSADTNLKAAGEIAAYPKDATDDESIPQSSDYDAGLDDE